MAHVSPALKKRRIRLRVYHLIDLENTVPGENLTRQEAQSRSSLLKVSSYEIDLDLTSVGQSFPTQTKVVFSCSKPGAESFIDAITNSVLSVRLNGIDLDPALVSDGTRITLPNLKNENILEIKATANYMNTGEGLHRFVDPVDNETYLYTQFEVPDSRRVFAVFEQPDLKATFQFNITAPSNWKVVSNQSSPAPVPIGNDASKSIWSFSPTPIIPSYITAIIAGPYIETKSELTSSNGKVIPLGVFSRASLSQYLDAEYIFEKTRQGFEFFERQFNYPYPFEKYDQLFVPEFNAGAMENAGAVTFTESYVFRGKVTDAVRERRVVTILHELAHMWFGDLVTMKWWNDLWLNESFAEYASTLATAEATEWKDAWTTFTALEKSWAYRQDQLPSTHPIVAEINDLDDVLVNFDGITYAKGASVLKQLVAWVGQEQFMAGVASYFKKHAYGNTELSDLLTELEQQSGRELKTWSKQWLETAGVNTLYPEIEQTSSGEISSFKIRQTATSEYPTLRPHRMVIGFYDLVGGKLTRVHRLELDISGATTEVKELIGHKRPDLVLLNDEDLAYAKIRFDEKSWQCAIENLGTFENSLARTIVWGSAWDSTRDAESAPQDFVKLVLRNIAAEDQSTTMLTLLRQLVTTANFYVAPENHDKVVSEIGSGLLNLARQAAPGSDAQLQFVKFFAQFANTEALLDSLKDIRTGKEVLEGLSIETDLDWELLTGLAVGARASEQDIANALDKDNTSNGQKAAAGARAALPSAESKLETWNLLTKTHDLSNVLVDAASLGFVRVQNPQLLTPYVDEYFENSVRIWQDYTFKIAEYLIENLYPLPLASQELSSKTQVWIDKPEIKAIPALRRIFIEAKSNVDRAILAQKRDKGTK